MGDVADMMLEGILCQQCGGLMDEFCLPDDADPDKEHVAEAPGYPQTCADCKEYERRQAARRKRSLRKPRHR
jgi:hypothetical protein